MFNVVLEFERKIADFFGAPYAVATDCCTHAVELCLRYKNTSSMSIPKHTYLSIPMTAIKLSKPFSWVDSRWSEYYYLTDGIYDAAVLWKANSYIKDSYMCISFQHKKHLKLGRGGMILCQNKSDYKQLKTMSYDGRDLNISPWPTQNVSNVGYHYYMTPETAQLGLEKLLDAINTKAVIGTYIDYPDISKMSVFNDFK
jgi:dTDP-4-amino-4,6-dideoxygalactose transaminase